MEARHTDGCKAVFSVGNHNGVCMACGCGICTVYTDIQSWGYCQCGCINWFKSGLHLVELGSFGLGFGLRLGLTLRISWSLGNNWASRFRKTYWIICRLCLCCHRRFECWLHSWIIGWWLPVYVIDYETNCTITVLHIMNNLTEVWCLLSVTTERLFAKAHRPSRFSECEKSSSRWASTFIYNTSRDTERRTTAETCKRRCRYSLFVAEGVQWLWRGRHTSASDACWPIQSLWFSRSWCRKNCQSTGMFRGMMSNCIIL